MLTKINQSSSSYFVLKPWIAKHIGCLVSLLVSEIFNLTKANETTNNLVIYWFFRRNSTLMFFCLFVLSVKWKIVMGIPRFQSGSEVKQLKHTLTISVCFCEVTPNRPNWTKMSQHVNSYNGKVVKTMPCYWGKTHSQQQPICQETKQKQLVACTFRAD